jgi:sorbitol-specific phosphotransferase system component IIBC
MIRHMLALSMLSALLGCGGVTATVDTKAVSTTLADGTRLVVLKLPAMV